MIYENNIQFAKNLDKEDKLSKFRSYFEQPEIRGKKVLYFCGNSLGLKPKKVDIPFS